MTDRGSDVLRTVPDPSGEPLDDGRAMTSQEPWAATSELRQALEEALASYDRADPRADPSDAAADGPGRDRRGPAQPSTAGEDRGQDGSWRRAPVGGGEAAASAGPVTTDGGAPEDAGLLAGAHLHARERDQYLDHLRRLQAEFDNYRKRVQRDSEALVLRAGEGVIESLLPVLDNMQRTLGAAEKHEEGQLIKGVELVSGQLRAVLEGHGLSEVPAAPGLPFDPTVHEAVVAQRSADHPEGAIVTVIEAGYLLHGRLLRPARVIVAR